VGFIGNADAKPTNDNIAKSILGMCRQRSGGKAFFEACSAPSFKDELDHLASSSIFDLGHAHDRTCPEDVPVNNFFTPACQNDFLVHAILGIRAGAKFLTDGWISRIAWTRKFGVADS